MEEPQLGELGSGSAGALVLSRGERVPLPFFKDRASGGAGHPRVGVHPYLVTLALRGSEHSLLWARAAWHAVRWRSGSCELAARRQVTPRILQR